MPFVNPSRFPSMSRLGSPFHSREMVMRFAILASLVALLGSCAVPGNPPDNRSVTTYYDRDNDGVVDYELHRVPRTDYWTWALVDTRRTGRYDV